MLWRVDNSRGGLKNAPAGFIQPCRPTVAKVPPRGLGWAHELKHDGYRLQIQVVGSHRCREWRICALEFYRAHRCPLDYLT
jgi:hypothetical protein